MLEIPPPPPSIPVVEESPQQRLQRLHKNYDLLGINERFEYIRLITEKYNLVMHELEGLKQDYQLKNGINAEIANLVLSSAPIDEDFSVTEFMFSDYESINPQARAKTDKLFVELYNNFDASRLPLYSIDQLYLAWQTEDAFNSAVNEAQNSNNERLVSELTSFASQNPGATLVEWFSSVERQINQPYITQMWPGANLIHQVGDSFYFKLNDYPNGLAYFVVVDSISDIGKIMEGRNNLESVLQNYVYKTVSSSEFYVMTAVDNGTTDTLIGISLFVGEDNQYYYHHQMLDKNLNPIGAPLVATSQFGSELSKVSDTPLTEVTGPSYYVVSEYGNAGTTSRMYKLGEQGFEEYYSITSESNTTQERSERVAGIAYFDSEEIIITRTDINYNPFSYKFFITNDGVASPIGEFNIPEAVSKIMSQYPDTLLEYSSNLDIRVGIDLHNPQKPRFVVYGDNGFLLAFDFRFQRNSEDNSLQLVYDLSPDFISTHTRFNHEESWLSEKPNIVSYLELPEKFEQFISTDTTPGLEHYLVFTKITPDDRGKILIVDRNNQQVELTDELQTVLDTISQIHSNGMILKNVTAINDKTSNQIQSYLFEIIDLSGREFVYNLSVEDGELQFTYLQSRNTYFGEDNSPTVSIDQINFEDPEYPHPVVVERIGKNSKSIQVEVYSTPTSSLIGQSPSFTRIYAMTRRGEGGQVVRLGLPGEPISGVSSNEVNHYERCEYAVKALQVLLSESDEDLDIDLLGRSFGGITALRMFEIMVNDPEYHDVLVAVNNININVPAIVSDSKAFTTYGYRGEENDEDLRNPDGTDFRSIIDLTQDPSFRSNVIDYIKTYGADALPTISINMATQDENVSNPHTIQAFLNIFNLYTSINAELSESNLPQIDIWQKLQLVPVQGTHSSGETDPTFFNNRLSIIFLKTFEWILTNPSREPASLSTLDAEYNLGLAKKTPPPSKGDPKTTPSIYPQ
jgi:hypothetical protein